MSNTLRRAEGLDDDPADVIGPAEFVVAIRRERNFKRDIQAHIRRIDGDPRRYKSILEKHAKETAFVIEMHLCLWTDFDDELPN